MVSHRKVGGIHFFKAGRVNVSVSVSKRLPKESTMFATLRRFFAGLFADPVARGMRDDSADMARRRLALMEERSAYRRNIAADWHG